jgi:uncharacterized delta-60 repeat protein
VNAGGDTSFAVGKYDSAGVLDPGFGTGGVATLNVSPGSGTAELARSVSVQPDGKVVLGGVAPTPDPGDDPRNMDFVAVRFTAAGSPDPSFGDGGAAVINGGNDYVPLLAGTEGIPQYNTDNAWGSGVLPDGRVVIFGSAARPGAILDPDTDFTVVGLTSGGELDTTFGTGGLTQFDVGGSFDQPRQLIVQPDGKIVVAGYETRLSSLIPITTRTSPVVARLLPTGQMDTSFGGGGIATTTALGFVTEAYQVGMQSDGSYVAAGYGRPGTDGTVDLVLYRFDADGNFDPTFAAGAGITRLDIAGGNDRARNVIVLPDDRILAVGSGAADPSTTDALVAVTSPDGIPETSFNSTGYVLEDLGGTADALFGVALAEDGETVWAGGYTSGGVTDDGWLGRIDLGT